MNLYWPLRALLRARRANEIRFLFDFLINGWMRNKSSSQAMQDHFAVWVRKISKNDPNSGIFVEVGANDPVLGSNTYSLERAGWTGLLVEPNPILANILSEVRKAKVKQVACGSKSGEKLQLQIPDGATGLASVVNESNKSEVSGQIVDVMSMTLSDLLKDCQFPQRIDYLSIDVEGYEKEVLGGLDLRQFQFNAITVEHNNQPDLQNFYELLFTSYGYERIFSRISSFDSWYIFKNVVK
jgi:FkbM family methyltransferase